MKIPPNPQRLSRNACRAGYPPSAAKTGVRACNALNSINLLSNNRQIFACNCYSQSLFGRADASNTDFYIITRFPKHTTGTTQRLYAAAVMAELNHADTGIVTWYPNYAPGTLGTGYELDREYKTAGFATLADGVEIAVKHRTRVLDKPSFTAAQVTALNEFEVGLLRFDHLLPVALGVFHRGPAADAPKDVNVRPEPAECSAGAPIRGHDGALYREGLGDLLYRTGHVTHTADHLSAALGSPLFSFGVPCGIWLGSSAGGADTRNIFGVNAPLRIRARSPYQGATVKVRPTVVYSTGTAGTYSMEVRYLSQSSGSASVSLTKASNPTLADFGDGGDLELNVDQEAEVLVEVTFDGDLDGDSWIKIHSLVLWPEYVRPGA